MIDKQLFDEICYLIEQGYSDQEIYENINCLDDIINKALMCYKSKNTISEFMISVCRCIYIVTYINTMYNNNNDFIEILEYLEFKLNMSVQTIYDIYETYKYMYSYKWNFRSLSYNETLISFEKDFVCADVRDNNYITLFSNIMYDSKHDTLISTGFIPKDAIISFVPKHVFIENDKPMYNLKDIKVFRFDMNGTKYYTMAHKKDTTNKNYMAHLVNDCETYIYNGIEPTDTNKIFAQTIDYLAKTCNRYNTYFNYNPEHKIHYLVASRDIYADELLYAHYTFNYWYNYEYNEDYPEELAILDELKHVYFACCDYLM